jgi:hypothetical protein
MGGELTRLHSNALVIENLSRLLHIVTRILRLDDKEEAGQYILEDVVVR